MEDIIRRARDCGAEVLVLDGDLVFGRDHLVAAAYHAARSIEDGTNSSDSLVMETVLYASGERQLGTAAKKMGVSKDSTELVVARLTDSDFEPEAHWKALSDARAQADRSRLMKFGISERELSTLDGRPPVELVLEKVAAVDILKR